MNQQLPLAVTPFFCLVGAAGSGKTTVASALLQNETLFIKRVVTTTSRLPRVDEVQGESYYFVSPEEFKKKISDGDFFEWEETHGNFYGTTHDSLNSVVRFGFSPLLIIDVRGALSFKNKYPDNSVLIFLSPSDSHALDERLARRGDDEKERQIRLISARREYASLVEASDQFDYLVINDHIQTAVEQIASIVKSEKMRTGRIDRKFLENLGPKEKQNGQVDS